MLLTLLFACDSEPTAVPPPRRFDAVMDDPAKVEPPEAFCDQWTPAESAKPFPSPGLDGQALAAPTTWRWVNVWATWCGPCVEEMPRLVAWQEKLGKEGHPIELVPVSVDAKPEIMSRWIEAHPGFPASTRISDPSTLPAWLAQLGLDAGTAIPIQLLIDPQDRLRCVRTGSLSDHHYPSIRAIVSGT